jgi:hypothetical protein
MLLQNINSALSVSGGTGAGAGDDVFFGFSGRFGINPAHAGRHCNPIHKHNICLFFCT